MKPMTMMIGTKMLKAAAMTRADYCAYRGWDLPENEIGADDGYLVEYTDGGEPNHPDHEGYISWSPADVFHKAYRPVQGLTFGMAIEAMKAGKRAARAGWNGKGMWVAYTPGSTFPVAVAKPGHAAFHRAQEIADPHANVILLPHFDMRAADGSIVVGWLASQTDMAAEDWHVLDGEG